MWKHESNPLCENASMARLQNRHYWLIQGHDSFETIFEMKVLIGQFTSDQIQHSLRALVAKAGLTYAEMVGAYATRRTKIANDMLEVHKDARHPTYSCGSNPFFTARIVDEAGKTVEYPQI